MKSHLNYQDLDQFSDCFACYLQSIGLSKSKKVALVLPNCFQYPLAAMAIHKIGGVVVNLNPELTQFEFNKLLKDSDAQAVIVLDIFAGKLCDSVLLGNSSVKTIVITKLPDLFQNSLKQCFYNIVLKYVLKKIPSYDSKIENLKSKDISAVFFRQALNIGKMVFGTSGLQSVKLNRNDLAFLQYTGGTTTGFPKAAMLSHGNILANIAQLTERFGRYFDLGSEVNIVALPMYHIFSLTVNFLFSIGLGCQNILITDPRDLTSFIKQIMPYQINMFVAVNTLFNKLMHHKLFDKLDFSRLKFCVAGGMALQEQVASDWKKITKHPVLEGYGLTEASPVVTMNSLDNSDYNGSIGQPLPNTEVRFFDDNQNSLPVGEVGEFAIRGPQVMQGYWNHPEETQKVITQDGFLLTGDMGYMDPDTGLVYLKERKKDVIIVSGFNVYPNEVESVLVKHAAISEAAVIGVPRDCGSEKIIAYVVLKEGFVSPFDTQELISHCAKFLTKYKLPKEIIPIGDLPKTNVGKVLRRKLREAYAEKSNTVNNKLFK